MDMGKITIVGGYKLRPEPAVGRQLTLITPLNRGECLEFTMLTVLHEINSNRRLSRWFADIDMDHYRLRRYRGEISEWVQVSSFLPDHAIEYGAHQSFQRIGKCMLCA